MSVIKLTSGIAFSKNHWWFIVYEVNISLKLLAYRKILPWHMRASGFPTKLWILYQNNLIQNANQGKFTMRVFYNVQISTHICLRSISLAYTSPYNIKYGSRKISLTMCQDLSGCGFLIACRATPKLINTISSITRKSSMSITCGR